LRDKPETAAKLRDKVVFLGVTAQSAADAAT
jgi:CHASE2 domain-containing sensor protein